VEVVEEVTEEEVAVEEDTVVEDTEDMEDTEEEVAVMEVGDIMAPEVQPVML
jgi:hypothetical protein